MDIVLKSMSLSIKRAISWTNMVKIYGCPQKQPSSWKDKETYI